MADQLLSLDAIAPAAPAAGEDGLLDLNTVAGKVNTDRTAGEKAKDSVVGLAKGGVGMLKLVPMAIGAVDNVVANIVGTEPLTNGALGNAGTQALNNAESWLQEKKSDAMQVKEQVRSANAEEAGKDYADTLVIRGVPVGKIAAETASAVWQSVKDPSLLVQGITENVATVVPGGLAARGAQTATGAVLPRVASALTEEAVNKIARTVGTSAAISTGAVQQGSDVAADTYDRALKLPQATWDANEEYKALAAEIGPEKAKARIAGELATQAGVKSGLESLLVNAAGARIGGATIENAFMKNTGTTTGVGAIKGFVKGAGGEAVTEAPEEGYGAYATNVAVGQIDPNQDPYQGVGTQAGLGAAGALGLGGVTGAHQGMSDGLISRQRQQAEQAQKALGEAQNVDQAIQAANALSGDVASLAQAVDAYLGKPAAHALTGTAAEQSVAEMQQSRAGSAELRDMVDRNAELMAQANSAGTAFDRQNALEQAQVSMGQPKPMTRDNYADLTPMNRAQAEARLAVMRDEAALNGGNALELSLVPHPGGNPDRFAIGKQPLPNLDVPSTPSTLTQEDAQNRLEKAALEGKLAQAKAEDQNSRQVVIDRALRAIEARGGVASPAEAQILQEAGAGKAYDRIDASLGPATQVDSTPHPMQSEAQRLAAVEKANAESMAEQTARNQSAQQQAQRDLQQQIAETGKPAQAPAMAALQAALGTPAPQRSAEQNLTIRQAQQRMSAEDFALAEKAAGQPFNMTGAERIRVNSLGNLTQSVANMQQIGENPERASLSQPTGGNIITTDTKFSTQREAPVGTMTINDNGESHSIKLADISALGDTGRLAQQVARIFGKRVQVFSSDTLKADGLVQPDDNKTIFLNSNSTISPVAVFGHELLHLLKRDNPVAYRALATVVAKNLDTAGRSQFRDYYGKGATVEELTADLVGNEFQDPTFWSDVFNEIGLQAPEGEARGIINRLAAALNKAIAAFLKVVQQGGFKSDQFIKDMTAVKSAVREAIIAYAQQQKIPAMQMEAEQAKLTPQINMNAGSAQQAQTPAAEQAKAPAFDDMVKADTGEAKPKTMADMIKPETPTDMPVQGMGKIAMSQLTTPDALARAKDVLETPNPEFEMKMLATRGGLSATEARAIATGEGIEKYRKGAQASRRRPDFENPEDRQEVSTTRPKPAPKKGRFSNSYDEKWVIDSQDVKGSDTHVAAVLRAIAEYNTLTGKGDASQRLQELHDVVVDNLLWLHDMVPENVRERAKLWYDGANRIATDWTSKYGISARQSSGVLAVLSPQMDWFKNVSLGERVISIYKERQNEEWSPAMTAWFESWVNAAKDVATKDSRQAYLDQVRPLQGVKLADMDDRQAAFFVRAFDETYYERQYRLVTPEGGFGEYVTNNDDGDANVTWGGFDSIEKAVSILNDGSFRNIDAKLGDEHKVRNFYNNIINPGSADGHVTIDTHAVAAALVKALSGSSMEVSHNFGSTTKGAPGAGGNVETGASGTYGLFADAYRDAASKRKLLPREMQSITWEAVRALFPASIKDQLAPKINAIWDRFKKGDLTREQARDEVHELAGGVRKMAWEGSDEGKFAANGGTSFNTEIDEDVNKRAARTLPAAVAKDKINVSLSPNTSSIQGISALQAAAAKGDAMAHQLLQDIARDNLRHLLEGTGANIKATGATGLYGGYVETSLALQVSFADNERAQVLAALAKFAENFNQEQIHVRHDTKAKAGTSFPDGSYATPVYRWDLKEALTRKQIEKVIEKSGLYGLTFGDDFVEAYYVGDPTNEQAIEQFYANAATADGLLGKAGGQVSRSVAQLWPYGQGTGAIGYERIRGDISAGPATSSETAKRVAQYLNNGGKVKVFDQAADITAEQDALQSQIAAIYESLPDNDLKNPNVRKAYSELAKEVLRQFNALPIKVEVMNGQGEPYANSKAMRRDILDNNHLYIFGTTPETFGPAGEDFSGHPLLGDTGLKDQNGYPLLYNDLLRAVHDYYAHAMSPTQFGAKGEEAAWKNHMAMTSNPWARWALTSETRGQNSWVNFRADLDRSTPAAERPFARQKAVLLPAEYALTGDRTVDKPMKDFIAKLGDKVKQGTKPAKPVKSTPRADIVALNDPSARDEGIKFSLRRKAAPAKTVTAYKLFRVDARRPGQLFPLFVNANDPVPMGKWLDADIGEEAKGGKVKSKIGPLAFRPGWHAGDLPLATHIGGKSDASLTAPDIRPDNQVWAEVEMAADRDWQTEANKRGTNAQGKIVPVKAHITDQIPVDGFYRYKTNANMTGNWLIGGSMKVTRILSDAEVDRINASADVADLPREQPFNAAKYGFDSKLSRARSENFDRWFGNSVLTNEDGTPQVLYHGTADDVTAFDLDHPNRKDTGWLGTGVYLTDSDFIGEEYAYAKRRTGSAGPNVMPLYARLENPYYATAEDKARVRRQGKQGANAFTEQLKAEGHDGVIYEGDGAREIVVFDPTAVKSATGNNGEYSRETGDISASRSRPQFFSQLGRAIADVPARLDNQPAQQWKAWLASNAAKLGVKKEEIEWSGVNDYLDLRGKDKVSKADIGAYLSANGVKVNTVSISDEDANYKIEESDNEYTDYPFVVYRDGEEVDRFTYEWEAEDFIAEQEDGNAGPQYGEYTLNGGENYREVLLTLPTMSQKDTERMMYLEAQRNRLSQAGQWVFDEDAQGKELKELQAQAAANNFQSRHFAEKNVVAHIRANDRTDADGNKVLFIEEVQSDWGQGGKKNGFYTPEQRAELKAALKAYRQENPNASMSQFLLDNPQYAAIEKAVPVGPFVGKTEGWLNLALKRIAMMAVEGGYDKVAFVNGQQAADRFDLSKRIDSIGYNPQTRRLEAYDKNRQQVINRLGVTEDQLDSYIGKEVATRLLAQPLVMGKHLLEGESIKVGGEGMLTFYDQIVPQAMSKLLPKLGGDKLTTVSFSHDPNPQLDTWEAEDGVGDGSKAPVEQYTQTGFDVTDKMRDSVSSGVPLFSRQRIVGDSKRQYTPEQRAMFERTGRTIDVPTWQERLQALRKDFGKKLAQGIADQFAPLKDLSKDAYTLARLSKGTPGAVEAFLHHGKLKLTDNVYDADMSGGFIQRLAVPLQGEMEDFLWWVAANRAERLATEDRENLFSPADIAAGKTLDAGTTNYDYTLQHGPNAGQVTRDRTLIYRDALKTFEEFNKNAMDMAAASGLIDQNSRQYWEHEFYVPFYRVSDEDGVFVGAKLSNKLVRQRAFKQLKGGTDKLNSDLLANTLQNWAHLIDAAAKNRAAKASLEAAQSVGVAVEADEQTVRAMGKSMGMKKNVVWFMDGGVERFFLVEDPMVMDAISSLEYSGMKGPLMDALSTFKHWLTVGVTASPAFKVKNLVRDSVQAVATAPLSYNVAGNIAEGIRASSRDSQTYVSALASGGLIRFGTMLENRASDRVRQLVKQGVKESSILDSDSKVQAFYDKVLEPTIAAYNELGNRGEEINRSALYSQLTKQGMSHADASLMARDLMDFSMQGTWTTIRFLTQVVPFMNARIQGLYKLGRAAAEDKQRFSVVLGATALVSLALMAKYSDDDDWKKREDWDRNGYWWFKVGGLAYRIPKPFEIGAIATLAERGVEYFTDKEMDGKRLWKNVKMILGDNLSMNPVPQAVKPIMDVYANKDSFTGRPIETMGMERLKPEYRYTANTSMVARGLSTASGGMASPVQIDHVLHGYFSWLGSFVVAGADMALRPMTNEPTRPAADYYKLASGGMVSELPANSSRYVTRMYDQAVELEQAMGTYKALLKEGKVEEAREFFKDNKADLIKYRGVEQVKAAETRLNERIRMIERSKMSPDQKKTEIAKVQALKDKVSRYVY